MTLEELKATLSDPTPPSEISSLVQALWYDAKGDWDCAHGIVQDLESIEASWIHAYLHRKEGDLRNASYWYHKAHRIMPSHSLQEEWNDIAGTLL